MKLKCSCAELSAGNIQIRSKKSVLLKKTNDAQIFFKQQSFILVKCFNKLSETLTYLVTTVSTPVDPRTTRFCGKISSFNVIRIL